MEVTICRMIPMPDGYSAEVPIAWMTRKTISQPILTENGASIEDTVTSPSPARNNRLRPNRSPSLPITGWATALAT
ncbi:hypothetical protein D3C73_1591670 [compost metagenome]